MEERITSMIPRYGKAQQNIRRNNVRRQFLFEKQQFISDFYREYGDTQTFETALISLMLEADAAHFSILLNSLKREIEGNISTYSACKEFLTVSIPDMSADSMKSASTGASTDR